MHLGLIHWHTLIWTRKPFSSTLSAAGPLRIWCSTIIALDCYCNGERFPHKNGFTSDGAPAYELTHCILYCFAFISRLCITRLHDADFRGIISNASTDGLGLSTHDMKESAVRDGRKWAGKEQILG